MESANLRILPRMKVTFEVGDVHPSSSNHLSYDEDSNSSVSWSWNRRCQGWCWDPNVRPALLVMYSLRKQYGTGSLCVDIYILYDSLYFSDKFIMWYKHYVFSLFSLCTYTYVYIYICITHDTWTFVASQIPTGNAGSLWLGSKLGCPLVNVYITMERSTIVHGKFHYFDWVIFNSYVTQSLPEATHLTFGWSFPHVIYPLVN